MVRFLYLPYHIKRGGSVNAQLGAQKNGRKASNQVQGAGFSKFFSKMWHAAKRKNADELIAKADALKKRADSLVKTGTDDEKFDARHLYKDALRLYGKAGKRSKEPAKAWLKKGACNLALAEWNDARGLEMDARMECQRAILNVNFVFFAEPQNKEAEKIVQSATEYLEATGGAGNAAEIMGRAQTIGKMIQKRKKISRLGSQFPFSLS